MISYNHGFQLTSKWPFLRPSKMSESAVVTAVSNELRLKFKVSMYVYVLFWSLTETLLLGVTVNRTERWP